MRVAVLLAALLVAGCAAPDEGQGPVDLSLAKECAPDPTAKLAAAERFLPRFHDDADTQARRLRAIVEQLPEDTAWTRVQATDGEFWSGPHRYLVAPVPAWEAEGVFTIHYEGPVAWTEAEADQVAAAFYDAWGLEAKDRPLGSPFGQDARQPAPYGTGSLRVESWPDPDRRPGPAVTLAASPMYDVSTAPWPINSQEAHAIAAHALACLARAAGPAVDPAAFVPERVPADGPDNVQWSSAVYSFQSLAGGGERTCHAAFVDVDATTGALLRATLVESSFCGGRANPEP